MKKTIFIILIIAGLVLPFFALSGDLKGPIVPCGIKSDPSRSKDCTLCDIFVMIQNIIDFILIAIFIISPILIVAGGIIILTSAGIPERTGLGKKIITNTVIGIIIALVSWTIINVVFNTLVGENPKGVPWPWYKIECVGGETTPPTPPAEEKKMCTCGATSSLGNRLYNSAAECSSQCNSYCNAQYSGAPGCCGTDVYLSGCSEQAVNRCSQMSAAGYCFGSNYYCQKGIKDQVSASAGELDSLLDCMAPKLPSGNARDISSITDNSGGRCITNWTSPQCSGGTDSCTGTCCAHKQNSLHYGGKNCRGTSYAVDFATESAYTYIRDAAISCANSLGLGTVNVINEGDHVHVELDGLAKTMGCI